MDDFAAHLEAHIPKLRRYARSLTRDPDRADDLVQDCLVRAIRKAHLWQSGTDLRAWLFTIMHNQHVNDVRQGVRSGSTVTLEDAEPFLMTPARQQGSLALRDLARALARLSEERRQVLLLTGLEGMRYEEIADILCVPVGTVRSRLSRARTALEELLGGQRDRRARRPDETWQGLALEHP
jgi:RNA polymerase sigma-70 factor (ECF subfamily)